jgi:ABC-2 type transport system ATP-binding protein
MKVKTLFIIPLLLLVTQAAYYHTNADEIELAATLYQPRLLASAPAVIYIHGWGGRRLTGTNNPAYYIAAAGYIVLSYTARGFGGGESGGRASLAGPNEISDLKHIIDWLLNNPDRVIAPRVTKIGVIGGSYGGGHSFQIASDPRVSAVVPIVGWTDLEQALLPNGVINYKLGLEEFYGGLDLSVGSPPFYNYTDLEFKLFDMAAEGRALDPELKQALRDRSIAERGADGREALMASRAPRAPAFIIQSWDDYLFPVTQVLDVFSQLSAPKQMYLGRQGHPPGGNSYPGEEAYISAQVLRWFDYHLRGIGRLDQTPITSAPAPFNGQFVTSSQFPPEGSDTLSLYLKADGVLSRKRKGAHLQETASGIFRPQRIRSSRLGADLPSASDMFSGTIEQVGMLPRSLVYVSNPFDSTIEMIGPSEFELYVSSDTSSELDVIARIYDLAPDGKETEVTVGVMRVSGLMVGEVRRVAFRDFGDNWVFQAGHRIKLKLTNIDFPDFRPPGANDNLRADISLHYGKAFPSSLKLTVRTR